MKVLILLVNKHNRCVANNTHVCFPTSMLKYFNASVRLSLDVHVENLISARRQQILVCAVLCFSINEDYLPIPICTYRCQTLIWFHQFGFTCLSYYSTSSKWKRFIQSQTALNMHLSNFSKFKYRQAVMLEIFQLFFSQDGFTTWGLSD